jgi:hypothetical protein
MSALWSSRLRAVAALALVAVLAVAAVGVAKKTRMQSTKLGPRLCETTGGGKFVGIPDFPGEKLDRRLLTDTAWLARKYKIFVTDGYAMSGHAANGEHPVGLALDIVPNKAAGGSWNDIDRLAKWAEPRQNHPRTPFRWVGYDGDSGHGRGHHLHLSWSHTETKPGRPAATVYTVRCPGSNPTNPPTGPKPPKPPAGDGDTDSGGMTGDGIIGSGGLLPKRGLAPVVPETGGTGLGD